MYRKELIRLIENKTYTVQNVEEVLRDARIKQILESGNIAELSAYCPAVYSKTWFYGNCKTDKNTTPLVTCKQCWQVYLDEQPVPTDVVPKLYPVCECGHVLKNLKINTSYTPIFSASDVYCEMPRETITPKCCPACGRRIKAIAMLMPDNRTNGLDFERFEVIK